MGCTGVLPAPASEIGGANRSGTAPPFAGSDNAAAISFSPHASVCLDNAGTAATCDGGNAPGVNSDLTTSFGVDAPDSNFGGVIGFTPPDWGVAADADITNGSVVAQLFPTATLSLFAGGCNTTLKPNFTLIDASTNIQDTIEASGPSNDTLLNLAQDADKRHPRRSRPLPKLPDQNTGAHRAHSQVTPVRLGGPRGRANRDPQLPDL